MNEIFNLCVALLQWAAILLGMTYQEINVWIFVIVGPLLFLASAFANYYLWMELGKTKKLLSKTQQSHLDRFRL